MSPVWISGWQHWLQRSSLHHTSRAGIAQPHPGCRALTLRVSLLRVCKLFPCQIPKCFHVNACVTDPFRRRSLYGTLAKLADLQPATFWLRAHPCRQAFAFRALKLSGVKIWSAQRNQTETWWNVARSVQLSLHGDTGPKDILTKVDHINMLEYLYYYYYYCYYYYRQWSKPRMLACLVEKATGCLYARAFCPEAQGTKKGC